MDLNSLIKKITPLYNRYKVNSGSISGTDALKIMWDIGDYLKHYIKEHNIAPHGLYRQIYGKSETNNFNIHQKSWITREFLGRCFRIRNIFDSKKEIEETLPNLGKFNLFREAMPFFDNPSYKLQGNKKEKLLKLLNSKQDYKNTMQKIRDLQKKEIGKENPRTQKIKELREEEKIFIEFYNKIYKLQNLPLESIKEELRINRVDKETIIILANNTNSLSQDGLKFDELSSQQEKSIEDPLWQKYFKLIEELSESHIVKIRRFRRIISAERIVKLADMLYYLYEIADNK